MGYNLLINGIYGGYNQLTNHLVTSWDIQVEDFLSQGMGFLEEYSNVTSPYFLDVSLEFLLSFFWGDGQLFLFRQKCVKRLRWGCIRESDDGLDPFLATRDFWYITNTNVHLYLLHDLCKKQLPTKVLKKPAVEFSWLISWRTSSQLCLPVVVQFCFAVARSPDRVFTFQLSTPQLASGFWLWRPSPTLRCGTHVFPQVLLKNNGKDLEKFGIFT